MLDWDAVLLLSEQNVAEIGIPFSTISSRFLTNYSFRSIFRGLKMLKNVKTFILSAHILASFWARVSSKNKKRFVDLD